MCFTHSGQLLVLVGRSYPHPTQHILSNPPPLTLTLNSNLNSLSSNLNPTLLCRYLKVETEDVDPYGALFKQIFDSFLIQLASSTTSVADGGGGSNDHTHHHHTAQSGHGHNDDEEERNQQYHAKEGSGQTIVQGAECAVQLYALNEYINKIFQCHYEARTCNGRKDAKQLLLRKLLAERNLQDIPCHIESVPLPLNPRLQIVTLNPESATIFASAVYPCVIEFKCLPSATGEPITPYHSRPILYTL